MPGHRIPRGTHDPSGIQLWVCHYIVYWRDAAGRLADPMGAPFRQPAIQLTT